MEMVQYRKHLHKNLWFWGPVLINFGEQREAIQKAINQHHIDQPNTSSDHFTITGHSIRDIDGICKARK